jgi:hypothetical protein
MAFYPCSNHHGPYRGASSAAYPAIVTGTSSDRRHLRMCQPCFGDYLECIGKVLSEIDYSGADSGTMPAVWPCAFCGAERDDSRVYVTAYPKGEPERSFYGGCCAGCEPRAKAEVLLS